MPVPLISVVGACVALLAACRLLLPAFLQLADDLAVLVLAAAQQVSKAISYSRALDKSDVQAAGRCPLQALLERYPLWVL